MTTQNFFRIKIRAILEFLQGLKVSFNFPNFLSPIAVTFNMSSFDPSIFDHINSELDNYIRIQFNQDDGSDDLKHFFFKYPKNS